MTAPPRLMLVCACLITLLRSVGPFEIGIDQAVQLEAAERLIRGQGLTSTYFAAHPLDLAQPTVAEYLTWFPPGFSLAIAGLLATGLSLLASLRIFYASVTLLGWLGWASITQTLLRPYVAAGEHPPGTFSIVAVLAPVFLTPSWTGSDVILWAAVPYVVMMLFQSTRRDSLQSAVVAGLLVGCLSLFRFASVFLVPAGVLILLQVNLPDMREFARRAFVYSVAALLGIVPLSLQPSPTASQGLVGYVTSVDKVTEHPAFGDVVQYEFPGLGMGLIGSPLLQKASEKIAIAPVRVAIGLMCFAGMFVLPFYAVRYTAPAAVPLSRNLAASLAILLLCLGLFLCTLTLTRPAAGSAPFLLFTRYFLPVTVASLLVWGILAGRRAGWPHAPLMGRAVICLLVVYYCGYLPVVAGYMNDGLELSRSVLGVTRPRNRLHPSTSQQIPLVSNTIYSTKETTRRKVAELHRLYPDAMFFIENYHLFVYGWRDSDGPLPGAHLRRLLPPHREVRHGDPAKIPGAVLRSGAEFWQRAYTSKPVRIFWVLNNRQMLDIIPADNRRWIFDDPFERTTIVLSEVPAGKLARSAISPTDDVSSRDGEREGGAYR